MLSRKKIAQLAERVWGGSTTAEPWHGDLERFARLVQEAHAKQVQARLRRFHRAADDYAGSSGRAGVGLCIRIVGEFASAAAKAARDGK